MFIEELKPMVTELTKQPIAFMGGFVSGILKLNASEEPLKSWLEKQGNFQVNKTPENKGPETITIE